MEWEDELKKHILKWIKEFDPEANMDNLYFIDIGLPEDIDFNEFSIPDLGKFYAYSIMKENYEQAEKIKEILAKKGRQTKWAPVWAVLKKFGPGKRIHPSAMTHVKRSWKRNKLHIRPRKARPNHYG